MRRRLELWAALAVFSWQTHAQVVATTRASTELPSALAAAAEVPKGYRMETGYASALGPFLGEPAVERAAQWPARRAALLAWWHGEMGPWPAHPEDTALVPAAPPEQIPATGGLRGIRLQRVTFAVTAESRAEAILLEPEGIGRGPAVVVPYYEPLTSVGRAGPKGAFRDYGLQLARRGFTALCLGTPGGNAWKPDTAGARCQPLSFHAFIAANAWRALAARPNVDAARIGIVGHSYGGKWALFGAALWEKYAAVAVSDPAIVWDESCTDANYWEPWYLGQEAGKQRLKAGLPTLENPPYGAYARIRAAGRDLTDLHALLCPRPFLVSGGAADGPERWRALNYAKAVNHLLGATDRVFMTNRSEHTPDAVSNERVYAFFEHFLKPEK